MEGNEPASSAWKSGHIRYRASCLTGFTWKAGPWRMAVSALRHDRSCCVAPLFCAEGPHEFPAAQGWLVLPHRTFSDRLTALRCCSLAVLEPLVRTCEVPTNQEAETCAAFLATRQPLVRPTRWTSTKRRQRATGPFGLRTERLERLIVGDEERMPWRTRLRDPGLPPSRLTAAVCGRVGYERRSRRNTTACLRTTKTFETKKFRGTRLRSGTGT
jgi:hypothetical protein